MATKKTKKNENLYSCINCDFNTCKKTDYIRHLATLKHNNNVLTTDDNQKTKKYNCEKCCRDFNDRSGLWRHKKKCFNESFITLKNKLDNEQKQQELIEYLLKENCEFKQLMLEQNKQMIDLAKNAGHNTTSNIVNNNSFNLNLFLNETCKNAMNIMDFVSQLQVGIKDLEETGRLGFSDGISKIFINGLKQINVTDRPIHCSDSKRETLYIKSNNEWTKDNEDKTLLTNAIKHVAHKNIKQLSHWTKEHPEYNDPDSKENDRYLKIVSESISGLSKEETNKNYNKIIKNIVKETVIDK